MQKTKINLLLVAFLVFVVAFGFSVVFADEGNNKQDESNQIQVNNEDITGEDYGSVVSKFIKGISGVADREDGIGEEVREIAKEQGDDKDGAADAIEKIKNRSKVKTFLIGTDYKNIGQLRSEISKTENHIKQLRNLLDKMISDGNKTDLQTEIQKFEQGQQRLETFLKANENRFSLFGWFVKLFTK